MTAYEYDNLPDSMEFIEALPEEMADKARAAMAQAADGGEILATEAKIAYAYARRGSMELKSLDGGSHDEHDLIIQITTRIRSAQKRFFILPLLNDLEARLTNKDGGREAEIAAAEAEAAQAEADAAEAMALAAAKRAWLDALRSKKN